MKVVREYYGFFYKLVQAVLYKCPNAGEFRLNLMYYVYYRNVMLIFFNYFKNIKVSLIFILILCYYLQ